MGSGGCESIAQLANRLQIGRNIEIEWRQVDVSRVIQIVGVLEVGQQSGELPLQSRNIQIGNRSHVIAYLGIELCDLPLRTGDDIVQLLCLCLLDCDVRCNPTQKVKQISTLLSAGESARNDTLHSLRNSDTVARVYNHIQLRIVRKGSV